MLIRLVPKIVKRTQCYMGFCRADERSVIRRMSDPHTADNATLIRPTGGVVLGTNRISTVSSFLQRGFTLVEILVVLVIVSLVSGILFQAMGQVMHLQKKFGVELVHSQQGVMLLDWFQQSVEGLMPDYADGKDKFVGSERRFSGLTTNPLAAENGVPTPLAWELAFDPDSGETRLLYGASRGAVPVISWQGNKGKFSYLDAKGEFHEAWPPPLGSWPQLPAAIRVEALRDGEPAMFFAAPLGPSYPPVRILDFFSTVK